MRSLAFLSSILALGLMPASTCAADASAPFVLSDTAVHTVHAARLNRDYEIYVGLPKSYATMPGRRYPVVFVTDAPYAFPLTRAISARVGGNGAGLPEFILVGLGYAKGDTPEFSRRRDYTPSVNKDADLSSDMPGRVPTFGEAAAYRRFLAEEVFPFIATRYRADMERKVFAGHSYGALFGADTLTREPGMFQAYVLGSPSLWFDHGVIPARKSAWVTGTRADIYIGAGEYEQRAPRGAKDVHRYAREGDMVADVRAFSSALASQRPNRLRLRTEVIAAEDHLTVAPVLITRGLLWVLGPR